MKNFTIEIKWALRFTLLTLAWAIGEKLMGLHDQHIALYGICTNLIGIPALLFYIIALKEKKRYFFHGNMNWQQGFISGIMLSFLIALLSPIAQYVIYSSITPHFFETIIQYKTTLKEHPMDLETARHYFNLRSYMVQSVFGDLSMGITTGAIISLVIRTKK
ncbi:DUF4199 domain-containing protein [Flavobacterium sp. XGLA_31]|uniref:DUF4199 domain-containing protein n=1 Tax=Flavobacterium sp. XGLA_31 TaxID=3447666 RepID=UPI003F32BA98